MKAPNSYVDAAQKTQTFWIMELLGWTYNPNGVWSKDGIKDLNKKWVNVIETKVKPKSTKMKGGQKRLKIHSHVEEIVDKYMNGMSFKELGAIYGCSHTSIRTLIMNYNEERTTS